MKQFAWSYSKLKNFETCPLRHNEIDNLKHFHDGGEALEWGNKVHAAMAAALRGVPLPDTMLPYQSQVDRVLKFPGDLLIEQKYAITTAFEPTEWFGPRAWYRGIADWLRVGTAYALVGDWKTGRVKVDETQLMLMCQCVFSHYPEVQKVRAEFIWLQDGSTTPFTLNRNELMNEWTGVLDRVAGLQEAHETASYPPKPGNLCRSYCPVTSCQFHGKGTRG